MGGILKKAEYRWIPALQIWINGVYKLYISVYPRSSVVKLKAQEFTDNPSRLLILHI